MKSAVPLRALLACALLAALLGLVLSHALTSVSAPALFPAGPPAATGQGGLASLRPAAQGPVSGAVGAADRAYWFSASGGVFGAPTPTQHLHSSFGRSGLLVSSGTLRVGLSLRTAGYGRVSQPISAVAPQVSANRVRYAHAGLEEWYLNGPLGLEQGFTVARAPSGRVTGPLTLSMALAGDARASVAPGGQSVTFSRGSSALSYGALVASDASGHRLPSRLQLGKGTIELVVDTAGARYPLRIDPLIEQGSKLVAPDASAEAHFGVSVALSGNGDTAVVGARGDDGGAGAAWVFVRSGSTWVQEGDKLTGGAEESEEAYFGDSVALSADGHTVLIGAPRDGVRGAAWVYVLSGSNWVQQGPKLTADDETERGHFGVSVALSSDGDTALIGGSADSGGRGAAWVFTRSETSWSQQGSKLTGEEEMGEAFFGHGVALSADGNTALIGGPGDDQFLGAAWLFTRSGSTWSQKGSKLIGAEESGEGRFGYSVALAGGGQTALVGGRSDDSVGAAWVFADTATGWAPQKPKLTGGGESGHGEFGYSVSLTEDGNTALIGGPRDEEQLGAAWVFTRSGTTWTQQGAKFTGNEESKEAWFGKSVALSADGATGLIGGPIDDGATGAVWTLLGSVPTRPTVTKVTPVEGPTGGGTAVAITGSGFLGGAEVTIGEQATSVDVLSSNEITAVTTKTLPGSYEVVVSDSNGTSSGGPMYTYTLASSGGGEKEGEEGKKEGEGEGKGKGTKGEEEGEGKGKGGGSTNTNTNTGGGSGGSSGTTTQTPSLGLLGTVSGVLPPPVFGVSGNLLPLSGRVLVKLPGSSSFVLVQTAEQVPFGTIVNATKGKVSITTVGPHGHLQTMIFFAGEFKLIQRRNGLVVAVLVGGNFSVCPTARERSHIARTSSKHASRKHKVRKLWSEGHGSYATQGNYASGAVLGTRWLTEDRCNGTYIFVATDRVAVTNLVTHHHRTIKAGHSYLAKAPEGKKH